MWSKKVLWVLLKTLIFTALVPYMVGLQIPYFLSESCPASSDMLYMSLPKVILGLSFLAMGAGIYLWCA